MNNKELGEYLKLLREKCDLSTRIVYERSGVSNSYLSLVENGKRRPSAIVLKKLAPIYNQDYLDLYEKAGYADLVESERKKLIKPNRIRVLGRIPAGIAIEMIEEVIDYEDISEEMIKGGKEYFALKVKGNSMEPKYLDEDVVIVLKQNDCESGQDCIVAVNGNDATFKRVFKSEQGITLQPLNNEYMPAFYSQEDIKKLPVKILGVVKEIRRHV